MSARSLRVRKLAKIVFGYWLFEAVLALFIALPVRAICDRAYGSHPEGDAILFRPGALELTDLVYRFDPSTSALPVLIVFAALVAALLGVVPLAAALASLSGRTAPLTRAGRLFPKMTLVLVTFSLAKGALAVGAFAIARYLVASLTDSQGEVRSATWGIASTLPLLLVVFFIGIFQDYVYAALVARRKIIPALIDAASALRARRLASFLHWSARGVASLGALAVASAVAASLGGRGGGALVALFFVHQLVQITRIGLRVSWLEYVTRAATTTPTMN